MGDMGGEAEVADVELDGMEEIPVEDEEALMMSADPEAESDEDSEQLEEEASLSNVAAPSNAGGDDNTKSSIGNTANNPGLASGGDPVKISGKEESGGSAPSSGNMGTTNQKAALSAAKAPASAADSGNKKSVVAKG